MFDFTFEVGGTHIFAAGGIDAGDVDIDPAVRSDIESVSVNIYGDLGAWQIQEQWGSADEPRKTNNFETARQGFILLRSGRQLFAVAGCSADTTDILDSEITALDTVEHAHILGFDTRPVAYSPVVISDGDLPMGTWYYRVSAVGNWGESLASTQVQTLNSEGTFEVCWDEVDSAASYNIYRSPASDGRPGTTRLIASEIVGTCYEDDGAAHPAPGFVSGAVQTGGTMAEGLWVYRLTATVSDTESVAGYATSVQLATGEDSVSISWNEVEGATYNIYRTTVAATEISGNEITYLLASGITETTWIDDGSLTPSDTVQAPDGVSILPTGTLSRWTTLPGIMISAREGAGATVVTVPSGEEDTDDKTYIYVAGGRPHAGGDGYLKTIERAEVLWNGDLGPWIEEAQQFNVARAFFPLLTTSDRNLVEIPGDVPNYPVERGLMEEPIFLYALAGDSGFSSPSNSGLTTFEAASVTSPSGALDQWYLQTSGLTNGRETYAHDGVMVDDYMFCFPGVNTESIDGEPSPIDSNTSRFPLNIPPEDNFLINDPFMAANAAFFVPRSYYDTTKVNSHVYLIGGNDGTGPISSVESIPQ